jgi:hypothetical protein
MKHSNPNLAISLPFTALSSSALSRRLPSQSELAPGLSGDATLLGRFLTRS